MSNENIWNVSAWSEYPNSQIIATLRHLSRTLQTHDDKNRKAATTIIEEIVEALSPAGILDVTYQEVRNEALSHEYREMLSSALDSITYPLSSFIDRTTNWEDSMWIMNPVPDRTLRRRLVIPSPDAIARRIQVVEILGLQETIMPGLNRLQIAVAVELELRSLQNSQRVAHFANSSTVSVADVLCLFENFWQLPTLSLGSAGFGNVWLSLYLFVSDRLQGIIDVLQRPCSLILLLMLMFVSLSCFLGVYFTVRKEYGYSMGDAFTLAGFVIAVGALICGLAFGIHSPYCKCWGKKLHAERDVVESESAGTTTLGISMVSLSIADNDSGAEHTLSPV